MTRLKNYYLIIQVILFISLINMCIAGPNPITDNNSDSSLERRNAYFYTFTGHPYWRAYSNQLKRKLKLHDMWEHRLQTVRDLDFKLREAWTVNDKPFNQN